MINEKIFGQFIDEQIEHIKTMVGDKNVVCAFLEV